MRIKLSLFSILVVSLTLPCHATLSFIGNGYVILNPNSAGDTYYKIDSYNTSGNPAFSGNILTLQYGQSLMLGGEIQTWQPQSGVTVTMHYSIDQTTTFSDINLNWFQTANNNDYWHAVDAVNIGSSLAQGTHSIYVWFSATDGGTNVYDSNNGANFSASLTVVPEPVTAALGAFIVIGLLVGGFRVIRHNCNLHLVVPR